MLRYTHKLKQPSHKRKGDDMYKAIASVTTKGYHPSSQWSRYGNTTIATADTRKELIVKLKSFYRSAWEHKRPMYCDKKDGSVARVGWVVGFRVNNGPGERYLQQDWLSIIEENRMEW